MAATTNEHSALSKLHWISSAPMLPRVTSTPESARDAHGALARRTSSFPKRSHSCTTARMSTTLMLDYFDARHECIAQFRVVRVLSGSHALAITTEPVPQISPCFAPQNSQERFSSRTGTLCSIAPPSIIIRQVQLVHQAGRLASPEDLRLTRLTRPHSLSQALFLTSRAPLSQ
ncbi:hypothetical protein K438DRAFT_2020973 [Mycena galopus ATCC 62051]|nr:hypothetical protein K438DRAFT_2020973 [Mycena galopus ATCC 62051]